MCLFGFHIMINPVGYNISKLVLKTIRYSCLMGLSARVGWIGSEVLDSINGLMFRRSQQE